MTTIYILFFLTLSIYLYNTKRYAWLLVVWTYVAYFFRNLVGNSGGDVIIFSSLIILFAEFLQKPFHRVIKNDKVGRIMIILMLYLVFVFCCTIFLNAEYPSYAFKVLRLYMIFIPYFVLLRIPAFYLYKYIRLLANIMFFVEIIFVISAIVYKSGAEVSLYGILRVPTSSLAGPLLLMLLFDKVDVKYRKIYIVTLVLALIATFVRGHAIAVIVTAAIYLIFVRKSFKLIIPFALVLIAFSYLFDFIETYKYHGDDVEKLDTKKEIQLAFKMKSSREFEKMNTSGGGTFTFRYALFLERMEFLARNPQYIPFGVGAVHEDSPNNKFFFKLGSTKMTNGVATVQTLDTGDIGFITQLMKFGVIYLLIFFWLLYTVVVTAYQKRKYPYMIGLMLTIVFFILLTPDGDMFMDVCHMIFPLILISLIPRLGTKEVVIIKGHQKYIKRYHIDNVNLKELEEKPDVVFVDDKENEITNNK